MSDWAEKRANQVAEDFFDRLRKQPTFLPALLNSAFVDIRNDALKDASKMLPNNVDELYAAGFRTMAPCWGDDEVTEVLLFLKAQIQSVKDKA